MASITLSVSDEFKKEIKHLAWVNWSELAREETMKKLIFENYMKTGKISDEEWEFCEKVDWHPVDELPLKEEFKKERYDKALNLANNAIQACKDLIALEEEAKPKNLDIYLDKAKTNKNILIIAGESLAFILTLLIVL